MSQEEHQREEEGRTRHALVQLIRFDGGQKTFAFKDFSSETFHHLTALEADNIIEEVPCENPAGRTYRLKKKFP